MRHELKLDLPEKQKLVQLSVLLARDIAGLQANDDPMPHLRQTFDLICKAHAMEPETGLKLKDILHNFIAVCKRESMKEDNPFWNYIRWPENCSSFLIGLVGDEWICSAEMLKQVQHDARRVSMTV